MECWIIVNSQQEYCQPKNLHVGTMSTLYIYDGLLSIGIQNMNSKKLEELYFCQWESQINVNGCFKCRTVVNNGFQVLFSCWKIVNSMQDNYQFGFLMTEN